MLDADGKYVCDHEFGSALDWKICNRRAVVEIQSAYARLHYCRRHAHIADDKSGENFTAKAGSEPRQLP